MEVQRTEFAHLDAPPYMQLNNRSIRHSVHDSGTTGKNKFDLNQQSRGTKYALTLNGQGRGSAHSRNEGASVRPSLVHHEIE